MHAASLARGPQAPSCSRPRHGAPLPASMLSSNRTRRALGAVTHHPCFPRTLLLLSRHVVDLNRPTSPAKNSPLSSAVVLNSAVHRVSCLPAQVEHLGRSRLHVYEQTVAAGGTETRDEHAASRQCSAGPWPGRQCDLPSLRLPKEARSGTDAVANRDQSSSSSTPSSPGGAGLGDGAERVPGC